MIVFDKSVMCVVHNGGVCVCVCVHKSGWVGGLLLPAISTFQSLAMGRNEVTAVTSSRKLQMRM